MNPQLCAVAVRVPGCRQQTATGVFTIEQPDTIRQTHDVPVVIGLDRSVGCGRQRLHRHVVGGLVESD